MSADDDEKRLHFIGLTMAEVTVIATALYKHQEQTDSFMGMRGLTRFHTSAIEKIKAYCDGLRDGVKQIEPVSFARWVASRTKHGPGGSGFPGDCDRDCVKCRAEAELQAPSELAGLLALWAEVERTAFINAGSTSDWARAYQAFEREIRRLLAAGNVRQGG